MPATCRAADLRENRTMSEGREMLCDGKPRAQATRLTLDIIGCIATLIMLALAIADWVLKFIL